jgi:hypothetical protein
VILFGSQRVSTLVKSQSELTKPKVPVRESADSADSPYTNENHIRTHSEHSDSDLLTDEPSHVSPLTLDNVLVLSHIEQMQSCIHTNANRRNVKTEIQSKVAQRANKHSFNIRITDKQN